MLVAFQSQGEFFMLKLIPKPKQITETGETFPVTGVFCTDTDLDDRILNAVQKLPQDKNGLPLSFQIGQEGEGYILKITKDGVSVIADGAAGAFYAVQTLRQIFTEEIIPVCTICDKPDFSYRGFYHDITRGKVPKLETLKQLIDTMAYYKLNSLQLYTEHTAPIAEYRDNFDQTGYITPEEIRELDAYCTENFIEFIPSISCFGHLYELLEKDSYKHLREVETKDKNGEFDTWENRMLHHTLDPTSEESFALVKSMLDQYLPLFSTDKVNICCDETFDLKIGKHKDADIGKLYTAFVTKIKDYLTVQGKTVMMWADIALQHKGQIPGLADDIIFLNWDYSANPKEENFKIFRDYNKTQIVCPGTGSWNRFTEDIAYNSANICRTAEYGKRYGAKGMLNTNWGDWGNLASIELALYCLVLGAEKSWSADTPIDKAYDDAVNHLVYGTTNGTELAAAISELNGRIRWTELVKCCAGRSDGDGFTAKEADEIYETAQDLIKQIHSADFVNPDIPNEMILAVQGIALIAELLAGFGGNTPKHHTDTEAWLAAYRDAWISKNKESELWRIERTFRYATEQTNV